MNDMKQGSDVKTSDGTFFFFIECYAKFKFYNETIRILDVMEKEFGFKLGTFSYNLLLNVLIDENHAIVSLSVGPEYYVGILSFVDKDHLEPGCAILMHNKVLSVVEILRSCTAEHTSTGIAWTVKKDITRYYALLTSNHTLAVYLGDLVDSIYTGVYHVKIYMHFYPVEVEHSYNEADSDSLRNNYDSSVDLILPVSRTLPFNDGLWFEVVNSTDVESKEVVIPYNVYRVVLEVYVSLHENDEFWLNYPDEYIFVNSLTGVPGNRPFREVLVTLDGKLVGAVWPFTVIFIGFSTEFVSRAWNMDGSIVKTLATSQSAEGIVKLDAGCKMLEPKKDHRNGMALNCEEAPLDVDIKNGGKVVVLNTKSLPLVGAVGLGADLVRLNGSAMCFPGFICDSALQVTYIVRGSGRAQVVGVSNVLKLLESSFIDSLAANLHDLHYLQESIFKTKQHMEKMIWCMRHQFLENVRSKYADFASWRSVVRQRKSAAVKRAWPDLKNRATESSMHQPSTLFIKDALLNLETEVLNGLLSRENQKEAISIPMGIIPAGFDNSLVWIVFGVRDPISTALTIIKGGLTTTNIFAVEWIHSGAINFGFLVSYLGFISDVLELFEKYQKHFGPIEGEYPIEKAIWLDEQELLSGAEP